MLYFFLVLAGIWCIENCVEHVCDAWKYKKDNNDNTE